MAKLSSAEVNVLSDPPSPQAEPAAFPERPCAGQGLTLPQKFPLQISADCSALGMWFLFSNGAGGLWARTAPPVLQESLVTHRV